MFRKIYSYMTSEIPIHIIMIITSVLPNIGISNRIRGILIKPFLGRCGRGFRVAKGVTILKPKNMIIGDNVYLAHYVWINAVAGLNIENNVIISPFCVIDTSKHRFENGIVTNNGEFGEISIGEGSWIATHSVIVLGVSISKGCLVAAGSVVTKDVEERTMVGGVPARVIKRIV